MKFLVLLTLGVLPYYKGISSRTINKKAHLHQNQMGSLIQKKPEGHDHMDASKCPHMMKQKQDAAVAATAKQDDDAAATDNKKCPLGKTECPYYSGHKAAHGENDAKPCPLKSGNCPYFDKHKKDSNVDDLMKEKDHRCPAENCPHFAKIRNGEKVDVDLEKSDCPLAEKCLYYQKVKGGNGKLAGCPVPYLHNKEKNVGGETTDTVVEKDEL